MALELAPMPGSCPCCCVREDPPRSCPPIGLPTAPILPPPPRWAMFCTSLRVRSSSSSSSRLKPSRRRRRAPTSCFPPTSDGGGAPGLYCGRSARRGVLLLDVARCLLARSPAPMVLLGCAVDPRRNTLGAPQGQGAGSQVAASCPPDYSSLRGVAAAAAPAPAAGATSCSTLSVWPWPAPRCRRCCHPSSRRACPQPSLAAQP